MRIAKKIFLLGAVLLAALALGAGAGAQTAKNREVWVGSWASSQQIPEPRNSITPDDLRDATMRQVVRLSVGGAELRVHISNDFGTQPLRFESVHIARAVAPGSSAIEPGTDRALTFSGSESVTVPAGAEYISDPIKYPVAPLTNLAISFYIEAPPAQETGHPGSRTTTFYEHGDLVSAASMPGANEVEHWYQISGVDVLEPAGAAAVVALGDSITDGHATTTNGNNRWTDVLAERLQASPATRKTGVLNAGIGGNRVLLDGLGPNALARFNRDVLAPAGVRWVIVFEGVNDLGTFGFQGAASPQANEDLVKSLISAYQQMITRAHAHGIEVIGATITPFEGSFYDRRPGLPVEADWKEINAWIRAPGHFDAVLDFAKVIEDPSQPDRLLPAYDSGDHLHPNPAGYRALGDSIPLTLFER